MATLTEPDDTGTLDRDAVQRAAQATDLPAADELDERADDLRDWLEARGVDVDQRERRESGVPGPGSPSGREAPTGPSLADRARAVAQEAVDDLRLLLDRITRDLTGDGDGFGPSREPTAEPSPPSHADISPAAPADEVERPGLAERSRWALVVAAWAAAVALLLPLLLFGVVSAFDMTLDLDAPAPAEQGEAAEAEAEPEAGG